MRKLTSLLLVSGAVLIFCSEQAWSQIAKIARPVVKEPYAVKQLVRTTPTGDFQVEVAVVNGDRWRVEVRIPPSPKIVVVVCDGTNTVANPPISAPGSLDPGLTTNFIITVASRESTTASNVTEPLDGHTCRKTNAIFGGTAMQLWIDSTTHFPVCALAKADGIYAETHYTQIPIDFTKPDTDEFFDTAQTAPFFATYLNH